MGFNSGRIRKYGETFFSLDKYGQRVEHLKLYVSDKDFIFKVTVNPGVEGIQVHVTREYFVFVISLYITRSLPKTNMYFLLSLIFPLSKSNFM